MRVEVTAILVGLLAAIGPAGAKDSVAPKPAVQPAANAHRVAPAHHGVGKSAAKTDSDENGAVAALEHAAPTPASFPAEVGWRLIEDPATGARIGLPENYVPRANASRTGSRWTSAQGQIQIETFRLTEAALPVLFEQEKKASRRQIASSLLKPNSFVITGTQGLKNFLVRADARASEVRGVTILYDQATEGTMSRVATAMVGAFAGFPDANAAPPPGVRRMVEYGSAVVMSAGGDLIASARLTDECQAITVPGLGHAERIAADAATDLALLRLYGVRNLVPATLASQNAGGDVNLAGVADPLSQAGEGAVSRAAARVSGQAVEPAPKPGFSGAAAVDAGGAVTGLVNLRAAVVAGNGSVSQVATLTPADAIRAFLQANGVAPAAAASGEHGTIEQSVVRVVCVRK